MYQEQKMVPYQEFHEIKIKIDGPSVRRQSDSLGLTKNSEIHDHFRSNL